MRKIITLWLVLGMIYVNMEVIFRNGNTHPSMLIVGGLCGVAIGAINQIPRFYKAKIVWQSLLGTAIVLAVEFVSGCVINLWWGWNVWDYSGRFGNIMGQICPAYGVLWFLIMPFAIWAEDTARWLIYLWDLLLDRNAGDPPIYKPYTLKQVYAEFFTLR